MNIDVDRIAEDRFQAKQTASEVEAALRALVARDSVVRCVEEWECPYCDGAQSLVDPDFEFRHNPDCPYVAAQALIARIDGRER